VQVILGAYTGVPAGRQADDRLCALKLRATFLPAHRCAAEPILRNFKSEEVPPMRKINLLAAAVAVAFLATPARAELASCTLDFSLSG